MNQLPKETVDVHVAYIDDSGTTKHRTTEIMVSRVSAMTKPLGTQDTGIATVSGIAMVVSSGYRNLYAEWRKFCSTRTIAQLN